MERFSRKISAPYLSVAFFFSSFIFMVYSRILSPFIHALFFFLNAGPMGCRFPETCSCYMRRQMKENGILKGSFRGFVRILKCNPFVGND